MEHAGLSGHAETVGDAHAVRDGADRARSAQMTTDQLARLRRDLGHARGDVTMAGAVKAVAMDAQISDPLVRNAVRLAGERNRRVVAGFKRRDLRHVGQRLLERLHRADVRRVVLRGDIDDPTAWLEPTDEPLTFHAGERMFRPYYALDGGVPYWMYLDLTKEAD